MTCSPWDIDTLVCDALNHLASQVEDGVLVRLHRLGRVDDKHEWRVQHLIQFGLEVHIFSAKRNQ